MVDRAGDQPRPSPGSASPSPGRPASWAPRCSSGCCARVPDCELVLLVRAGRALDRRAAGRSARSSSNDAFDRLRDELRQRRLRREIGPAGHRRRRRREHATASASTTPAAATRRRCDIVIHSAATVSFDSPLDGAVEVNLLGPDPHRRDPAGPRRHAPPRRPCRPATSPATGAARHPRSWSATSPFSLDDRLARARSTRPAGRAADAEAASRDPRTLAQFRSRGPPRARRRGHARCSRRRPSSCAQRWVGDQHGRGRTCPRRVARLARRVRVHQGARRAGAARDRSGDVPVSDRAPVDHRVRARRAAPGLDPRLPHGRAGDHLLRPRPAEGVPRRARGHRRRDPGRPRGRRDHRGRGARARTPTAPPIVQVASGSANPLRYRRLVDLVQRVVQASTRSTTATGQPIVVPEWTFPGRGRVQGQLNRAKRLLERAEKVLHSRCRCAASRPQLCRHASRSAGARSSERSATSSSTAPTPSARRSTASTASWHVWRQPRRRGPGELPLRPARHRLDALRHRGPPAVRRRSTPGCGPRRAAARARRATSGCAAQVLAPDRHLAAFDLENTLIASNVVDVVRVARHPTPRPRRPAAVRR